MLDSLIESHTSTPPEKPTTEVPDTPGDVDANVIDDLLGGDDSKGSAS